MVDADDVPRVSGMPTFGLGTWKNTGDQCAESVRTALELGYRHVDTAQAYDNETEVGHGLAAADVPRDDLFVATKLWQANLGREDVLRTARGSRDRLGVDVIDLLYVHWPRGAYDPEVTLPAMAELVDDGVIERVGVSNFTPDLLAEAVDAVDVPVFANQVELHPLLPQPDLRTACEDRGVEVVAYSPLARGEVFEVPEIQDVAEKHGVTPAEVSLAWLRGKGVTTIPKATSEGHIRENFGSLGVDLDPEDVERIDGIDRRYRAVDPRDAPW